MVFLAGIGLGVSLALPALSNESVADKAMGAANQFRRANEVKIINDFKDLLRLPNHGSNDHDIRKNAAHITEMMERRGITTRLLEVEGAPPAVFGLLDT
ncbi:MAG: hypothetical protein V3R73_00145, partial [Sphingomonadales bacterium]